MTLAVLAAWRFAPGLLPAVGVLLAWGAALGWGQSLALARCARESDSLRQEVGSYRRLFESRPPVPPARPAPAPVSSSGLAPANIEDFIRDPLTGLFHRRYFEASLEREIHRMERRNLPLGIILMDLDGFDGFTKAHGQEASEALLRALGALLNRRVRGGDVASRYEGGTFGLLLPEAPLEGVQTRAEQLRSAVRELQIGAEPPPANVTLSLGAAAFPDSGHSSAKVLQAVKAALEDARAAGGGRVSVAPGAVLDRRLMLPD